MGEQVLAVEFPGKGAARARRGGKIRGVLAVAKVPARLSVEMSEGLGSYGQTVGEIAEAHGGLLSMTCNGFLDPGGQGNGGELAGFAMSDGVAYGEHYPYMDDFPYARFEILTDNTVCIRRSNEEVRADCRDATEFNPALIIDGEIIQSQLLDERSPARLHRAIEPAGNAAACDRGAHAGKRHSRHQRQRMLRHFSAARRGAGHERRRRHERHPVVRRAVRHALLQFGAS